MNIPKYLGVFWELQVEEANAENVRDSFSFLFHLSSSYFLFFHFQNVTFVTFCTETTGI